MLGRVLGCALIAGLAQSAHAQFSGAASIVSDFQFRGVSLTDRRPTPVASLAYDDPSGLYAGVLASEVLLADKSTQGAQMVGYAGFAGKISSTLTAESGITLYRFLPSSEYNYAECYAGFAAKDWSARIYLAPNYFGSDTHTLYGEVNYAYPVSPKVHLIGHLGALRAIGRATGSSINEVDFRLGVSYAIENVTIQTAWVNTNALSYLYPTRETSLRSHWVVSATYRF